MLDVLLEQEDSRDDQEEPWPQVGDLAEVAGPVRWHRSRREATDEAVEAQDSDDRGADACRHRKQRHDDEGRPVAVDGRAQRCVPAWPEAVLGCEDGIVGDQRAEDGERGEAETLEARE
jgi:hypothetical protein